MDWAKIGELGIGIVAVIGLIVLGLKALELYFQGKNQTSTPSIDDSTKRVLEENTKAITQLTTFLQQQAVFDKELRRVQEERTLSILGKVDDVEKVVRDTHHTACQTLEQLNKRPCQK